MKTAPVVSACENGLLAEADLQRVLSLLQAGEPVALPTETVYGLAADACNTEACSRIFAVKERPFTDPLICHLPHPAFLDQVSLVSPLARSLAAKFWPGALTLVLPKQDTIPDLVTAGSPKVAVRCSTHPIFSQIVQAWNGPLAAPSANRFGRISPTTAAAVQEELGDRIALIVDGGPCALGVESTIIEPHENALHLLRRGPIQPEELESLAPVLEAPPATMAPGRLPWHYAPTTPLSLWSEKQALPPQSSRSGLLAWNPHPAGDWALVEMLSPRQSLAEAAQNFYAALRRLDAAGLERLYAEELPAVGLGRTLMERLHKAAARG